MPEGTEPPPRGRTTVLALAVLVGILLLSLPWSVASCWDLVADGARAVQLARALARGEGYTFNGEPYTLRPPGFSAMLVPVIRARGLDLALLNLTVSLLGALATVALFLLTRERIGPWPALSLGLLFWTNPRVQWLCNTVQPDVPAAALALVALLLIDRAERSRRTAHDLAAALAVLIAIYVRVNNAVLLPAWALARWFGRRGRPPADRPPRSMLLAGAVVLLGYLPWAAWAARMGTDAPRTWSPVPSYATAYSRSDPYDPGSPRLSARELGTRVAGHAAAYAALFASGLRRADASAAASVLAAAALACVAASLWRRSHVAGWFALGSVAMLLPFAWMMDRYLLLPFVLVWASVLECLRRAALSTRALRGRPAAVEVLLAAGVLVAAAVRFERDFLPRGTCESYQALLELGRHVRQEVPPQTVVAGDTAAVYAVVVDRVVYQVRGVPGDWRLRPAVVLLRRLGPCAVFAEEAIRSGRPHRTFGPYVLIHYPGGPEGAVPDSGCRNVPGPRRVELS